MGDPYGNTDQQTIREVLERHSVQFGVLFGSQVRGTSSQQSDVDIAFEFDDRRPGDEGYANRYLQLLNDLDETLPVPVDLVDVHTISPSFARVTLEEGTILVGTETRRDELVREYAGEKPTLEDAKERVAAAADRLRAEES